MMSTPRLAVLTAAALMAGAVLPGLTMAAPTGPSDAKVLKRCVAKGGRVNTECAFYPRIAQPRIYAAPAGEQLFVVPGLDPSRGLPDHFFNDYVADPDDLASGRERVRLCNRSSPAVLWIARHDIVRASELRRVTRCWPVTRLVIANGDEEEGTITMKPDGSGVVSNPGEPPRPVHAWYFEGVYSVRGDRAREWAWGNVDVATGRIVDRANWASGEDARLSDRAAMGGACSAGVVVD